MPRHPLFPRVILLSVLLVAAALASMLFGAGTGPGESLRLLLSGGGTDAQRLILLGIRLPRVLLAALAGGTLAVCGVMMQGMFRNPLADPHILGVSSGAALGATLAMALGLHKSASLGLAPVSLFAFVGGTGSIFLVYALSRRRGRLSTTDLLLSGVAVSALFSAAMMLIMRLNHDKMENIIYWTMGSFSSAGWKQVLWSMPFCLVGSGVALFFSRDLNLLSQGSETAGHLGVHVTRTRIALMLASSVATAGAVAATGIIGFVGLIVPHASRMLFGPDHRRLVPLSFLSGALFMLVMDTLARTLASPLEIPVGTLTALCGAPFFLFLLRRRHP